MIGVEADASTDARPEAVFDFIATAENHEKFMPSLVEVSDVEDTDTGIRGRYVFKLAGQTLEGTFNDTEFDRPNRRAYDLTGDAEGTVTWTVEPSGEETRVGYRQEFTLPGPDILETIGDPIARKYMQREANTIVENVATLVEESAADAAPS